MVAEMSDRFSQLRLFWIGEGMLKIVVPVLLHGLKSRGTVVASLAGASSSSSASGGGVKVFCFTGVDDRNTVELLVVRDISTIWLVLAASEVLRLLVCFFGGLVGALSAGLACLVLDVGAGRICGAGVGCAGAGCDRVPIRRALIRSAAS